MGICHERLEGRVAELNSPLDTGNDGVGVGSLLGSLVSLLDDDNLLSCLSAGEDDGDFSGLVD
jgi:hypothetical protein